MSYGSRFRLSAGVRALWLGVALAGYLSFSTVALPAQQFRGLWVYVFSSALNSATDVTNLVTAATNGNYNAIVVQVLAYMDNNGSSSHGAMWKSKYLPWSTRVTSSFDPLTNLCLVAHAHNIQVHAWLGGTGGAMYRVSLVWPINGNSYIKPGWMMVPRANSEGGSVVGFVDGSATYYLLDMGGTEAQDYIVSIVRELVSKYPIDGINWDDEINGAEYDAGVGYPALSTSTYTNSGYARYRRNTGYSSSTPPTNTDLAWSDYRRRFKNELMARCQAEIQAIPNSRKVRHTSNTMAYGDAPSTCTFSGTSAYLYFSDWATMLANGWLDAAIPMDYKVETVNHQMFVDWCDRSYHCWSSVRDVFILQAGYLNTMSNNILQLAYACYGQPGGTGLKGAGTYHYTSPATDANDWWGYVATNLFTNVVTVPDMPWRESATATKGMIWGRVQNGKTGDYIDDATVTITGGPTVQSDGNGYYVATLIDADASGSVYPATAAKSGLASVTTNATVHRAGLDRYDIVLRGYTTTSLHPITPNPACAGASVTLTATVAGTNSPTGQVQFFDGAASLGTANLSGGSATKTVSSLGAGTHTDITATYLGDTANSTSTSAAGSVTINAIPDAPTAGNNSPIGVGATLHLTASTITGAAYAWTGPNGFTSSAQNPSIPNTTTAASGQYMVTATVGGCTSSAGATTAIIVPPPTIAVSPTYDSASGTFRVAFAGISNVIYSIERAPSVTGPWSFLEYATGGPQGVFDFSDTELPAPPERYYRALTP